MSAVPQHVRQGAVDPPLSKAAILLTALQTWPAQWYRLKVVKTLKKNTFKSEFTMRWWRQTASAQEIVHTAKPSEPSQQEPAGI